MAMDFKSASFIKAVEKWADATESEFVATCGGSMLMLQRMVVDGTGSLSGTPKDTGQAKSNWFIGVNEDVTTQSTDTTKQNMQNAQTIIAQAIANPDNVKFISLSNNLPYIRHLEYGLYSQNSKTGKTVNGFSTQAPNGMFRISVAQFERIFNQQLAARRKK